MFPTLDVVLGSVTGTGSTFRLSQMPFPRLFLEGRLASSKLNVLTYRSEGKSSRAMALPIILQNLSSVVISYSS